MLRSLTALTAAPAGFLLIALIVQQSFAGARRTRAPAFRVRISAAEAERRGIYDVMRLYMDEVCIKEVPFFIALHRCFSVDPRIKRGKALVLTRRTILALRDRAVKLHRLTDLKKSDIECIDSLVLFKKGGNRYNQLLCNFEVFVRPGKYRIPETGADVVVPEKVFGSIHYSRRSGKMVVYIHCAGIKLHLPRYAKAMSLGILDDLDVGFAELEMQERAWTARLLYVKKLGGVRTGWSFNATECRKIRPYKE
ncbi:MAG: hypothetical protein GF418_11965 [Chitinivibrionales bacterium]|nr:hypothetical protein [Chitinivibrionales bacterium]MBD3396333.1 hypothetical protein [Chitinivibrionales bacterium]